MAFRYRDRRRSVPRPRRFARVLATLFAAWIPLLVAAAQLPDFGDPSAAVLTPQRERQIGEALLAQLRSRNLLIEDLDTVSYIESLGSRLAQQSGLGAESLTFFVVKDMTINAFAAPGGMIGVHSGLILASETESELAGVIAHEIAHVSQRHMARTFEAAGRMQIPVAVGILAAILLGQAAGGEAGQAALAGTLAGSQQAQIDFIRTNEEEADRIGIQILAAAGFDPIGMPDFFERLERQQRLYGSSLPEFLRTHPVNISRIASARDRARQLPPVQFADRTEYRLTRMRIELQSAPPGDDFIERLRERIAAGNHEARYELALALVDRGKGREALDALQPLLAAEPDRPEYLGARAEGLASLGDMDGAAEQYRTALAIYPGQRSLTLGYAQLLLNRREPLEARALLTAEVDAGRASRGIHRLLSDAALQLGDEVEMRRQRAEWLLLDGRSAEAAEELRRALNASEGGSYTNARISARLREVELRLAEIGKAE